MWALKYSDCREDIAHLIENIVKICDPDGLSNQALIGEASKAIKKLDLDLTLLLVEPEVFKKGFLAFLKQDPMAKVQDSEFDDLYTYLLSHLQGEIGRWSEEEVQRQELYWRMAQSEPKPTPPVSPTPPTPYPSNNGNGSGNASEPNPVTPEELAKRRNDATEHVNKTTDEALRHAVMQMIQNENEQIIDIVMKYVQ